MVVCSAGARPLAVVRVQGKPWRVAAKGSAPRIHLEFSLSLCSSEIHEGDLAVFQELLIRGNRQLGPLPGCLTTEASLAHPLPARPPGREERPPENVLRVTEMSPQ